MRALSRRALLASAISYPLPAATAIRRERFLASPGPGTAVMANAFYTRPKGGAMISVEQRWSRSDTVDIAYVRHSDNNGRTWSPPMEQRTGERRPEGMYRRHPRSGFVDASGVYIEFLIAGILPSDDPLEGLRNWNIYYRISRDGRTFSQPLQIVHRGEEFNDRHPLPGVWTGKNCVMLGDMPCAPINAPNGDILLPVQIKN